MKYGFGAWFGAVHVGGGLATHEMGGVLVLGFEAAHLCLRHVFWSVFEVNVGLHFLREEECQDECRPRWEFVTVGTRIGYPLLIGPAKRQELRFGLGVAWGSLTESGFEGRDSLVLIPGIRYQWALIIVSLQLILPTSLNTRKRYPAALFMSVGLSFGDLRHTTKQ
jgi:hypothetical protein